MLRIKKSKKVQGKSQLELELKRPFENDRNHHLGGKSFYFFDFDDNVIYLTTPIVVFHKDTGKELFLSSSEWAQYHHDIGIKFPYNDYYIDYEEEKGSFRYFRDQDISILEKVKGSKQTFLTDIENALKEIDYSWKAPSWNCFYHAVYNNRPMSIITARGHNINTIKKGINLLAQKGHIPTTPNFLSIYPVTNTKVRKLLGDIELKQSVAELKRSAIRESVEAAIKKYGYSPFHRFGMSDDDPKNIELITEEMKYLKRKYSEMSFFVIQTFEHSYKKFEILPKKKQKKKKEDSTKQLNLF